MNNRDKIGYEEALKILTPREIEILDLVGKGYTSREIANRLYISINTVWTHRKNIKKKIMVTGPRGLVKWYLANTNIRE